MKRMVVMSAMGPRMMRRCAHWIHVLLTVSWETGRAGRTALSHVGPLVNRRDLVVWSFMDRWGAKLATQMICSKPSAAKTPHALFTASGRHGVNGANAPSNAMVVRLFGTGPKTSQRNMEVVSVKVLPTRRWCAMHTAAPSTASLRSGQTRATVPRAAAPGTGQPPERSLHHLSGVVNLVTVVSSRQNTATSNLAQWIVPGASGQIMPFARRPAAAVKWKGLANPILSCTAVSLAAALQRSPLHVTPKDVRRTASGASGQRGRPARRSVVVAPSSASETSL